MHKPLKKLEKLEHRREYSLSAHQRFNTPVEEVQQKSKQLFSCFLFFCFLNLNMDQCESENYMYMIIYCIIFWCTQLKMHLENTYM